MRRVLIIASLVGLAMGAPSSASAENIVVESGQTLWEIARRTGCSVEQLQRANRLRSSMIYAGQKLTIPDCDAGTKKKAAGKKKVAASKGKGGGTFDDDGMPDPADYDLVPASGSKVSSQKGQSIGRPWDGSLVSPTRLDRGKGYHIRRPHRAYGTKHAVAHIERAIKAVRKRFPRVHTLAIGDLSQKRGGEISMHRSHQSGRDVDIGFYFKKQPKGYPDSFVGHDGGKLDLAATWALLYAFARTADSANGVQAIFLDWEVQEKLYEWAKDHGVPVDYLDKVFQYPERGGAGLVRHVDNHHDHFHIRFKCADGDSGCDN